jgi:hypothetical protein
MRVFVAGLLYSSAGNLVKSELRRTYEDLTSYVSCGPG